MPQLTINAPRGKHTHNDWYAIEDIFPEVKTHGLRPRGLQLHKDHDGAWFWGWNSISPASPYFKSRAAAVKYLADRLQDDLDCGRFN